MEIRRIDNKEEFNNLEKLRFEACNIVDTGLATFNYYLNELNEGNMLAYGIYNEDELVAGCYVSSQLGTLYIDYIFVKPMYQNTGMRLGRTLLMHVLENKKEVGDYFNIEFDKSTIAPNNPKAEALYVKLGYEGKSILGTMHKRI